jgi:hypothetical protein
VLFHSIERSSKNLVHPPDGCYTFAALSLQRAVSFESGNRNDEIMIPLEIAQEE